MAIPLKDAHKRAVHFFNTQCTTYVKPCAFSGESIRSVKKRQTFQNIKRIQDWIFNKNPKTFGYLKKKTNDYEHRKEMGESARCFIIVLTLLNGGEEF